MSKTKKMKKTKKTKKSQHALLGWISRRPKNQLLLVPFVLLFAFVGAFLLLKSEASPLDFTGQDRYGVSVGYKIVGDPDADKDLDSVRDMGSKWVRLSITWSGIETSKGIYNWDATDVAIAKVQARGMKVLGKIGYTPQWARPAGTTNDKYAPVNLNDYADFARAAAQRYAPKGVHYWEIWNEPNITNFWKDSVANPNPNPSRYAQLLIGANDAIKSVDSGAVVITGGTSPTGTTTTANMNPRDFLSAVYAYNGGAVKGKFDAVGHHPYCFDSTGCPNSYHEMNAWSEMVDTPVSLRSIMTQNGDGAKKIWATEFGAPTGGNAPIVTESDQARMVNDTFNKWSTYAWAGPLFWYQPRDLNTSDTSDRERHFGLLRTDFSKKPAWTAFQTSAIAAGGSVDVPLSAVKLSGVTEGQQLSGAVVIQAIQQNIDVSNVNKVDFYLDGALIHTENVTEYCLAGDGGAGTSCYAFNTAQWTDGTHTLRAVMTYNTSYTTETSVNFSVKNTTTALPPSTTPADTTAPAVTITSPANGAYIDRRVTISAKASDTVGVTKMEIYIDGKLKYSVSDSTISYKWSSRISKGRHTITVNAFDAAGNKGTTNIAVNR